jgi:DDE superfamily endonuclease
MQLPIVAPAPIVTAHADIFRDLFEHRCQFRHFQHYLTGLIVLDNKSLANITRCVLNSADKTNLSRFFSDAPWFQDQVNDRRLTYLLQQTQAVRGPKADGALILDDTLCEHVGSLFDYVDRHYNHGDATYPLAHNPVTSHYVSGPVRFPVALRLYRRYEECTRWEEFVRSHFPARPIPTQKKERARLHKAVDPVLLQDPDFEKLHFQLTARLWPALKRAGKARVVSVSSNGISFGGVDFDDPHFERREYDKWKAYGQSKTANALFAVALDKLGQAHGIRAFSVHPGGISTDLVRYVSDEELAFDGELKTPEQGAATSVWCATSPQLEGKGGVYCMDVDIAEVIADFTPQVPGQQPTGVLPWAIDPDLAERLWQLSEKMTGVKFSG